VKRVSFFSSKATFLVALEVFICTPLPLSIAYNAAITQPASTKRYAFAWRFACFYRAIYTLLVGNWYAFEQPFACVK
jgi:hypothetical protein